MASFGDAFGTDDGTVNPGETMTGMLASSGAPMPPDYQSGMTVNPADVMTRMLRKGLSEDTARAIQRQQEQKGRQPAGADVFGTPVTKLDPTVPQDVPGPEPEAPVGWSDLPGVGAKSFIKGAIQGAGATVKGIAGVLAHGADSEPSMTMAPERPPTLPAKENPVYQAGQSIEDFGEHVAPLTKAEQDTYTARVAGGLGGLAGMAPGMAAGTVLGGPAGGLAAGGAQMGLGAAAATFDAAVARGVDEDKAAAAAGISGVLNAALGVVPLGVVLRPLERMAGTGIMGYAASKLAMRAAEGATAFATIGEAQEWLAGQIEKDFYPLDPKHPESGYTWDGKRFTANAITGAIAGLVGGLRGRPAEQEITPPPDLSRGRLPAPGTETGTETGPGPGTSGGTGGAGAGGGHAGAGPGPGPGGAPGGATGAGPAEPGPRGPESDTPDQTRRRASMEEALRTGYGVDPTDMSFTSMAEALRNRDILTRYGFSRQEIQDLGDDNNPKFKAALQEAMEAGSHHPSTGPGSPGTRENPVDASGIDAVNNVIHADPSPGQAEAENYRHIHAEVPELGLTGKNGISIETVKGGTRNGPILEETPPAPGMTRFYRGEKTGGAPFDKNLAVEPGSWFTTDKAEAAKYGDLQYVDLSKQEMMGTAQDANHPGKPFYILDKKLADRRQPLKEGQPAWTSTMGAHYGRIKGTKGADGQELDIFTGDTPNAPSVFVLDQKDPKTGKFDETKIFARFSTPFDAFNAYLASHDSAGPSRIGGMRALNPEEFKEWLRSGNTQGPLSDLMKAASNESTVSQTRPVETPGIRGVAESQGQVQKPEQPGSTQLPRAGDHAAPGMGGGLRGVPGGSGQTASGGIHPGEGGQQRSLRAGERPLGDQERAGAQHAQEHQSDLSGSNADNGRVGGGNRAGPVNPALSSEPGWDVGRGSADNAAKGGAATSVEKPLSGITKAAAAAPAEAPPASGAVGEEPAATSVPGVAAGSGETAAEANAAVGATAVSRVNKQTLPQPESLSGPSHNEENISAVRTHLQEAGVPRYPHDHIDVARAAKIAAQEGWSFDDAFQLAVVRNRVDDGFLTPEQVHEIYGQEIAAAVDAGSPPQRGVRDETQSPSPSGEAAAPEPESGPASGGETRPEEGDEGHQAVTAEGGTGAEPHPAGAEPVTEHAEPDTGKPTTGAEPGGRTEPEPTSGELATESTEQAAAGSAEPAHGTEVGKPAAAAEPAEVNRLVISTGVQLRTKSGRITEPAPRVDATGNRKTINTIARIDGWLLAEAKKEPITDYVKSLLDGINIKNMSQSDRDTINEVLFGDAEGATEANVVKPEKPGQAQAEAKPEETKNKIEDAGEKIGGARKDQWGDNGLDVKDLESMNPAERVQYTTKENVWPRPDYEAMVEGGVDPKAAFLIKRIYDRLATSPPKADLIEKYIRAMRIARSAAEEAKTVGEVERIGDVVRNAHMEPVQGSTRHDYEGEESIRIPNKTRWKTRNNPFNITFEDRRAMERAVAEGFPKTEPWQRYFEIHKWADSRYKVYRKGKKSTSVDGEYKTREEAQAAARAVYESWKAEGGETEQPKDPVRPHLDSLERTGPDYRGGRNVAGSDFIKDFGFRGVEFGNWVAGDERQKMVNQAYDGLHDLARVLGLPPKAMSLNGTLAMGFGSRGKGGRAAAHYEPALKVFNFTKLSGAGSVAHEWAHALDHYLGELASPGSIMPMVTGGRGKPTSTRQHGLGDRLSNALVDLTQGLFARQETAAKVKERVAHEIAVTKISLKSWEDALERYKGYNWGKRKKANELETARQQIDMRKRKIESLESGKNMVAFNAHIVPTDYHTQASKVSGSDYYTRPEEMFARAFESWVFDRLTKEGQKSDYLVHGVEPTRFAKGYKGNPYPFGEEREAFNKGFDRLARALTTTEGKHGADTKLEGLRGEDPDRETSISISIPTEPAEPAPLDNPDFVQDLDQAGEAAATEVTGPVQPKPLAQHFLEHFRTGEGFPTILQARKFAKDAGFDHDAKAVEESIELAVVKRARELVEAGKSPTETFTDLRYLYGQQPNLGTRTSTSVRDQAYSTPVPLAYVASRLAGITHKTTVYEPTAGNGALLIEADPKHAYPNELNPGRYANLQGQGLQVTAIDASHRDSAKRLHGKVDRVIANPPFGAVTEGGESKVFDLGDIQKNYKTTQIDHAIALEALKAMKDDGKAVLILGGINKQVTDPKDRSDAYHGKAKREFFKVLYDRYNVVDHVTVDGDLYSRQGAAWPIDLVVIDGRGKSARSLPAVDVPRVLHTWDEVGGLLNGQGTGSSPAGRPDDTSVAAGADTTATGGHGGGGGPVEPGGPVTGPAEPNGPGSLQPGTLPTGEPAKPESEQAPLDQARGGPGGHGGAPDTERRPPGVKAGLDDLGDILNDALDQIFGPDLPPEEQAQQKPKESQAEPKTKAKPERERNAPGELSASAQKAFEALGTMFGGKAKLSMGVTVDPEKYEQAKPLFIEAGKHFRNFIDDLREFANRMLAKLQELFEFTKDALKELLPYIQKFIAEVHLGQIKLGDEEPRAKAKTERALDKETALQVRYTPKSDGPGMGTLVPVNMRENISASLRDLEKRVGNLDDYVTKELGYASKDETWKHLGAEQVDAAALAIDNMAQGKGFIIGDQTGIGKGRVNAVIIRWALKNDKIPVFFTKGPDLFADIYRDLVATGIKEFLGADPKMLMTNGGERVPLDEEGKVVISTPPTSQHNQHLNSLNADNFRDHHDMVFTTYNQINTVKQEETARRNFLQRIAPNAVLVFDESHNAGGQAGVKQKPGEAPNRAIFARRLIDSAARNGTFYSSATYAKRPDVMDLYRATDMRLAAASPDEMTELFKRGGIPMQQVVASMLAEGGQYIRRERSFDGITYDTPSVEVDKDQYNGFSRALSLIQDFSKAREGAVAAIHNSVKAEGEMVAGDGSTGGAGASSINFTSIMHNIINQMLLAAKAKPAADMAIAAIERGEKPVLTVANTMGSFLADYADNLGISHGEEMPADFRDVLMKYLDRTRTVTIKKPFMKKGEKGEKHYLTDDELGWIGVAAYNQAKDHIQQLDLSNLSVSPIDDIKSRIEAAGYRVGEITGRNDYVDFSGKQPSFEARPGGEKSITGRRKTISNFNKHPDVGGSHAVLINQAGSTGISMHASEDFQDQRQRHMIIVQPEANIDTHMQMLGRVHRTGQVVVPKYAQMVADIPAEKRPAAVLSKKMASLNANTTASRGSALTAENVPDFMNEVGDKVAAAYITENPEMNRRLAFPILISDEGVAKEDGAMRSVTGRIPLLPLHEQEEIYQHLESEYKSLIEQMDAAGENILEAKSYDLQAKTTETTEVVPKKPGSTSPFAAPVMIEKATIRRLGKPMTSVEIANRILEELRGGGTVANEATEANAESVLRHIETNGPSNSPDQPGSKQAQNKAFQDAISAFNTYKRSIVDEIADPVKAEAERVKLDAVSSHWSDLRRMLTPASRMTLKTASGNLTGIVLKIEHKGQAKNPLALGTWKATFAVADASKQLTIPFSRLFEDGKSDPENSTQIEAVPLRYESYADTLSRFESQQNQLHEDRYLATGNLLAAYNWLNTKGRIINYTDDKGALRQGIITPQNFDLRKYFLSKSRVLGTPQEVMAQLAKDVYSPVYAKDGFVRVENGRYGLLQVTLPKSKKTGGKYFLDKPLAALTDTGDFVSSGLSMIGKFESRNALAAIARLQELGAVFGAPMTEGPKTQKVGEGPAQPSILTSPQPRALIPGQEKARAKLEGELRQLVERLVGKSLKGLEFPDTISASPEGNAVWGDVAGSETYGGAYFPIGRVIQLAMADPKFAGQERALLLHEIFHHFKNVLANDKETALMDREVPRLRTIVQEKYGFDKKTVDSIHPEEILALAAESQMSGEPTTGVHIGLRPFFDRVRQVLTRIGNFLRGLGYRSFEDVVDSLYQGQMASRESGKPRIDVPDVKPRIDLSALGARAREAMRGTTFTKLVEGVQDLSKRVKLLQDEIEARAMGTLPDSKAFYTMKRLFPGKVGTRRKAFDEKFLDPITKHLKTNRISLQEIGDYLYARHAHERNDAMERLNPGRSDGSGMTDAEASHILAAVGRDPRRDAFEETARMVKVMRNATLNGMVRDGLITPELAEAWRNQYNDYVPLKGFEVEDENTPEDYREPGKFTVRGPESKRALGRRSKADNPLTNSIDQAYRAIQRGEKDRYLRSLASALASLPRAEREDIALLNKGRPRREIDPRTGLARTVDDWTDRNSPNAVHYKVAGESRYMVFKDRTLAEAVKLMHPEGLGMFDPLLRLQNKIKALWTHYSPDFLARHFLSRYPIEGTMNAFEETGLSGSGKYIQDAIPFWGNATKAIFVSNKGEVHANPEIARLQADWEEMQKHGGAMTFRQMRDVDLLKEHLETQLRSLNGRPDLTVRDKWRKAVEGMDVVTNALDNSLRLAAYTAARRNGKSPQQAALAAREATVDFQLKGKWSNAIGLWFPFGNVAIQTSARMLKAVGRSRIMRRVFMGTMLAGFLTSAYNYLMYGNDEDSTPFFEKIPEWDRRMNFIIMTPFKDSKGRPEPIKIPMPYNWALPLSMGYGFGGIVFGKLGAGKAMSQMLHSALESLTPIGGGDNPQDLLVPELLRPVNHLATNRDAFDRPIHADPDRQKQPNAYSGRPDFGGRERTGQGWKTFAESINDASGGNSMKSGKLDFYPEDYREVFNYLAGAQMREAQMVKDTGQSLAKGEAPSPTRIPVVRQFVGTDYDAADRAAAFERSQTHKRPWAQ